MNHEIIKLFTLVYNIRSNLNDYMEHVLRNMMRQIDNYRANERENGCDLMPQLPVKRFYAKAFFKL